MQIGVRIVAAAAAAAAAAADRRTYTNRTCNIVILSVQSSR